MGRVNASSEEQRAKLWACVLARRAEYFRLSEELDAIILSQNEFGGDGLQPNDRLQLILNLRRQEAVAFEKFKRALSFYWNSVRGKKSPAPRSFHVELTPREQEVLAFIANGKTMREIANELGRSFKTISCHRWNIMTKLDAHRSADLIKAAIRMGLIEP
jgi:DNA-binding NarL/FixJ family response regulator